MAENPTRVTIEVAHTGVSDAETLDRTTRQLAQELRDLGSDSVELVSGGPAPEGTRSAEAITLGALVITLAPTMLPKLIEYLQAWKLRGQGQVVRIKAQAGDKSVEVEYPPAAMSRQEITALADRLTRSLKD